ncbi:MAG: amino acid ABC transporter permease [Candidatus Thalassarchaeaceae archaeon]|jgi:His/Glu/Gln/Arg/opine family amino acid ABC transporter permease subunit|nr:amino acid ABC transporter permease [Candidatus Thalassarchaeaceae archaeon]
MSVFSSLLNFASSSWLLWRDRIQGFSLREFEESVVGKNGNPLINEENENAVSSLIIGLSVTWGAVVMMESWRSSRLELNQLPEYGQDLSNANVFAPVVFLLAVFVYWVTITAVVKFTWRKTASAALLGITTAWIIFYVVRFLFDFVLIEAEWVVVWANRDLVMMGQLMKEQMTQSPGSHVCIDVTDCYGINQNFRLWWSLYLAFGVLGAAYGTSGDKPHRFVIPFLVVIYIISLIASHPTEVSYETDVVVTKIAIATSIALTVYSLTYYYSLVNEEYKVNRLKSYVAIAAVLTFFFSLFIMDPPELVKEAAEKLGGIPVQSLSDDIIAGEYVPTTLDKLAGDGIEASQWGGLFVNLIIATAGCVLGFGIGVVLAFGRQSDQPFFSVPCVAVIELVRSGPLICWLYFAVFMMPDIMDPFYNAEDIIRMLLMFGIFGGCYIAEVLRGGLQAVDSGQKEAAAALGLSPAQIKLQIELPNAVRTTLPSIISVFIGLWKDTTLLFIVNILDFFKLAKDLPNSDLRFLGDFLEPLYVTAVVFWIFAFYLSRVSMRIEKNLGLVREGGGEAA